MMATFNPKTEIGRDGVLRRHRAVRARNRFEARVRPCTIRSARWTRAGTAQRAVPATIFVRPTSAFGLNREIHEPHESKGAFSFEKEFRVVLCVSWFPEKSA
jgi:hypothetical protein